MPWLIGVFAGRTCNLVCVEVLRPSQPNGVMSSAVSLSRLIQQTTKLVIFFFFFYLFIFLFYFFFFEKIGFDSSCKLSPLNNGTKYSRLSLIPNYRLFEVKIWFMFKHENLLWKRGEIAPKEQFLLFSIIFSIQL